MARLGVQNLVFYFRGYEDILCYWRKLLLEYAELAQWTVEAIEEYKIV